MQGVVYIAFGEQWCAEARRSIASLRKVSGVQVAVVTDTPWSEQPQPDQFVIRPKIAGWASKPRYMLDATPFDMTLFIDTDTVVMRDPSPAFGLLEHYDIGVRFGGPQLGDGELALHTQCNSGVVLFRKCEQVSDVFDRWNAEYSAARERVTAGDTRGLADQRYLSIAIAKSRARPVHLAEYMNFALFETLVSYSPVVVVHGRGKDLEQIGAEINGRWNPQVDWMPRLWLSNIRGILPAGVRRSDPVLALAIVLRRIWNASRRAALRLQKLFQPD